MFCGVMWSEYFSQIHHSTQYYCNCTRMDMLVYRCVRRCSTCTHQPTNHQASRAAVKPLNKTNVSWLLFGIDRQTMMRGLCLGIFRLQAKENRRPHAPECRLEDTHDRQEMSKSSCSTNEANAGTREANDQRTRRQLVL